MCYVLCVMCYVRSKRIKNYKLPFDRLRVNKAQTIYNYKRTMTQTIGLVELVELDELVELIKIGASV